MDGEYPVVASTNIKAYHNAYKVKPPVVVTGRSGSLGKVQYIDSKCWPLNTSLYSKDFRGNNPKYIYYFLQTMHLEQYNAGAGVPTLNQNHLQQLKIVVHDIDEQKKVSYILSAYDNLIENNNKRIQLLEQIAGGDAPDDSTKEITDECSIPIYSNGIENEGLYGYTSKAKISKPSITISARGTVGYTCLRRVSYTPIVRLICVIPHEEKLVNWLFYYFKRTIVIANGTSQQQITIPMMSREKVLLPTNNLIQNFYEYSTCYLDEIDSLKAQNSNLEKQRDMLLPRLMSGKLEV